MSRKYSPVINFMTFGRSKGMKLTKKVFKSKSFSFCTKIQSSVLGFVLRKSVRFLLLIASNHRYGNFQLYLMLVRNCYLFKQYSEY